MLVYKYPDLRFVDYVLFSRFPIYVIICLIIQLHNYSIEIESIAENTLGSTNQEFAHNFCLFACSMKIELNGNRPRDLQL